MNSSIPYESGNAVERNKVLRNTYALLAMTLTFSAVCAGVSMVVNLSFLAALVCNIVGFVLLFVIGVKRNSAAALPLTFLFTGLMGAGLGPLLSYYVESAGPGLILQALGTTALIFFSLSAYALTTKKDFSFLGGFLIIGLMVAIVASIANIFMGIPALSLAINAAVVFIMSGFILFDTSRIIRGGETNYVMATVSLYLNILNLFTSLLHLLNALDD
jgi:modulator of FtsH protease